MPPGLGTSPSLKRARKSSATLARASTHSPLLASPLRSTRAWVRPALDVSGVPSGTTRLQMYLSAFTDTEVWGHTAYTESALSLVLLWRSSEPFGCSWRRQDHASTGYWATSHTCSFAAWMPRPSEIARRNRRPFSSRTVYAARPASLRGFQSVGDPPTLAREQSLGTEQPSARAADAGSRRTEARSGSARAAGPSGRMRSSMPGYRPRRHHWWTSWSTTWTSWVTVRHSFTMSQEGA